MQVRQRHPTPETQCAGCRSGAAKDRPAPCRSGSSPVGPAGRGHRHSASWWASPLRCKSTDTIRTGRVRLSHSPCGPPTHPIFDHPPHATFSWHHRLCFALAGDCFQEPAGRRANAGPRRAYGHGHRWPKVPRAAASLQWSLALIFANREPVLLFPHLIFDVRCDYNPGSTPVFCVLSFCSEERFK